MVFFNYTTMELAAKIVYYGPGLCGKTTNLQYIYRKTAPKTRGEMVCLATETDRTLFFDLLPIKLGNIGGFNTRFQLYTVPGQVFYNSTRKLVLKGVDAVVFVADSQEPMLDANIESFENLEENLKEHNLDITSIPLVLQYNKRDLPNTLPVSELDRYLNKYNVPRYEAVATVGKGVLTTLKEISKLTLKYIRRKVGQPFGEEPESLVAPAAPAAAPSARAVAPTPVRPPPDEEEVEFDISGGTEISEAGRLVVPSLEPRVAGPGSERLDVRPPAPAGGAAPRPGPAEAGSHEGRPSRSGAGVPGGPTQVRPVVHEPPAEARPAARSAPADARPVVFEPQPPAESRPPRGPAAAAAARGAAPGGDVRPVVFEPAPAAESRPAARAPAAPAAGRSPVPAEAPSADPRSPARSAPADARPVVFEPAAPVEPPRSGRGAPADARPVVFEPVEPRPTRPRVPAEPVAAGDFGRASAMPAAVEPAAASPASSTHDTDRFQASAPEAGRLPRAESPAQPLPEPPPITPLVVAPAGVSFELPLGQDAAELDVPILEKEVVQKVRVPIRMSELDGHQRIKLRLRLEVECVVVEESL